MNELVVLHGDDWQAIYFDGKLQFENHRIEPADLVPYVPQTTSIKTFTATSEGLDWLSEFGHFPENLNEVPREFFDYYVGHDTKGSISGNDMEHF